MNKKILLYIRNVLATIFTLIFIFFLCNLNSKFNIQFLFFDFEFYPLLSNILIDFSLIALCVFLILIVITFLFGRIYCSFLCPLGLFQEIIFYITKPFCKFNKKFESSKPYKYIIAAIFYGSLLGGSVSLAKFIEPYTLSVAASSYDKVSLIIVLFIALLVIFKRRFFCTNICPVGAILGLISKKSLFKLTIDPKKCVKCKTCVKNCQSNSIDIENGKIQNETCIKCFKCTNSCKLNAISYKRDKKIESEKFSDGRRKFLISAISFSAFLITFKEISYKVKNEIVNMKNIILPPGARSSKNFIHNCLNCNLCVKNCPQNIIKPKDDTYDAVHLDLSESFCKFDCNICSQICPAVALKKLSLQMKQNTIIGKATIDASNCLKCGICKEVCPKNAINIIDDNFPKINNAICIGCGKCAFECPAKTIHIEGIEEQDVIMS